MIVFEGDTTPPSPPHLCENNLFRGAASLFKDHRTAFFRGTLQSFSLFPSPFAVEGLFVVVFRLVESDRSSCLAVIFFCGFCCLVLHSSSILAASSTVRPPAGDISVASLDVQGLDMCFL